PMRKHVLGRSRNRPGRRREARRLRRLRCGNPFAARFYSESPPLLGLETTSAKSTRSGWRRCGAEPEGNRAGHHERKHSISTAQISREFQVFAHRRACEGFAGSELDELHSAEARRSRAFAVAAVQKEIFGVWELCPCMTSGLLSHCCRLAA